MLKKQERLTRKEFDRAFSAGKRLHSPSVQLIYAPSDSFHGSVVVGKKVFKKAVDRNRLRRQLYALLYQFQKGESRPMTYILITKPPIVPLTKTQRIGIVKELLEKVPHTV